jgi:hypothetical protein
MSELQDRIDALTARMRPHAASPVTATRRATDSAPPAGVRDGYGTPNSLSSRRRGGRYPNTYRMRAADYAGNASGMLRNPVLRPTAPNVTRTNGLRVARDRTMGGMSPATAKAMGEDNGRRMWSSARGNLQRDAGDAIGTGESYPRGISRTGRLAPSARY